MKCGSMINYSDTFKFSLWYLLPNAQNRLVLMYSFNTLSNAPNPCLLTKPQSFLLFFGVGSCQCVGDCIVYFFPRALGNHLIGDRNPLVYRPIPRP